MFSRYEVFFFLYSLDFCVQFVLYDFVYTQIVLKFKYIFEFLFCKIAWNADFFSFDIICESLSYVPKVNTELDQSSVKFKRKWKNALLNELHWIVLSFERHQGFSFRFKANVIFSSHHWINGRTIQHGRRWRA